MKWNKKVIKLALLSKAKELGYSPSVRDVPISLYGACNNYFGNFNRAKKFAGLTIQKPKYNPIKISAFRVSNEFAYILGVVYGDGSYNLRKTKYRSSGAISLSVKDPDFAINFKKTLERWSGLKAKYKIDKKNFHTTVLYSMDACQIIDSFNLYSLKKWHKRYQFQFLRGLFDSDGGVFFKNQQNRKYAKRWIHLSNNDIRLISITKDIFNKIGIKYSSTKRIHSGFGSKKLQYEIKIYNLEGILKYYKNIGFSIHRKQNELKKMIYSYDAFKTKRSKDYKSVLFQ